MSFRVLNTQSGGDISSIEVDDGSHHWELICYNHGAFAGKLTVISTDGPSIINRLIHPGFQKKETYR